MSHPAADRPIRVLMVTSEWPQHGGHTSHFIARQADFLRAAGVAVDVFAFRGSKSPLRYISAWFGLRRRLRRQAYDVVHAQFGQSALLALPKRHPLVVTFRGDDVLGIVGSDGRYTRAGRILQRLSRLMARRADAVIVVSSHMRQYLDRPGPLHVIPSGLDLDRFRYTSREEARRRLRLPPDKSLVLFVGDPGEARKRYGLAREAVELLARSFPSELVLAWRVPHGDMPLYLSACDALVFTSLHEGSPNAVKEALACDLPVVSVPVGDVPERLRDVAGCTVCADDRAETIAAALEPVLRRRQRVAGRAAVRSLDERALTERVIAVYRSVLNGADHGAAAR
jgi:teichuronic acid biosynthesis glycosyltransferase TuaC